MMMEAASIVLVAVMAAGLGPKQAWSDRAAWRAAPGLALTGVDGKPSAPTKVRARWNESWLFVEFVCKDADVVSPGKEDGLDHWKLGDVVEVFLGRTGASPYAEIHATPAGRKTIYFFHGYRQSAPMPPAAEDVVVQAEKVPGGWRAMLAIPWAVLGGGAKAGDWQIFAGRYDYPSATAHPVLSSCPPQTGRPDFHRRETYARLELRP
jgi:hypothetical protein